MKAPKCFLFLLLMSGLFFILTWQAQAGNQKIEVAFQVSINELVKKMPKKLTVYRTVPDEVGQTQREALKTFLGKGSHFELQEASGGVFAGDMTRLWNKAPGFTDQVKTPDKNRMRTTAENFLEKIWNL